MAKPVVVSIDGNGRVKGIPQNSLIVLEGSYAPNGSNEIEHFIIHMDIESGLTEGGWQFLSGPQEKLKTPTKFDYLLFPEYALLIIFLGGNTFVFPIDFADLEESERILPTFNGRKINLERNALHLFC